MLTATLPETRSYDARQLAFIGRTLTVQQGKKATRYAVTCLPTTAGVVRAELRKDDGTTYTTTIVPGTRVATCTCPAGHYKRFGCVHVDALREIADELTEQGA